MVEPPSREMESKGAIGSATAGELASKVDVIICSLPNAKIVESVMCAKAACLRTVKREPSSST